jgi:hypothetical protein
MIIQGPAPVVFVPAQSTVQIQSITFDMLGQSFTFQYCPPGNGNNTKSCQAIATPAAMTTALHTLIGAAVQAAEGWASAPVVTSAT